MQEWRARSVSTSEKCYRGSSGLQPRWQKVNCNLELLVQTEHRFLECEAAS